MASDPPHITWDDDDLAAQAASFAAAGRQPIDEPNTPLASGPFANGRGSHVFCNPYSDAATSFVDALPLAVSDRLRGALLFAALADLVDEPSAPSSPRPDGGHPARLVALEPQLQRAYSPGCEFYIRSVLHFATMSGSVATPHDDATRLLHIARLSTMPEDESDDAPVLRPDPSLVSIPSLDPLCLGRHVALGAVLGSVCCARTGSSAFAEAALHAVVRVLRTLQHSRLGLSGAVLTITVALMTSSVVGGTPPREWEDGLATRLRGIVAVLREEGREDDVKDACAYFERVVECLEKAGGGDGTAPTTSQEADGDALAVTPGGGAFEKGVAVVVGCWSVVCRLASGSPGTACGETLWVSVWEAVCSEERGLVREGGGAEKLCLGAWVGGCTGWREGAGVPEWARGLPLIAKIESFVWI